ncbi:hypothetical protein B0H34DRAFT_663890, partial [Crassisporium funariophilum]
RPQTAAKLYNLCHAQARNVVERIFGVMEKCWDILVRPPKYPMLVQVHVPSGHSALHNFITIHNPSGNNDLLKELDAEGDGSYGDLAIGDTSQEAQQAAIA